MPVRPLHILVYSDPSGGKSTFLATLPKPMKVLSFDPFGKETPYTRVGTPGPIELEGDIPVQRIYSRKDSKKMLVQIEHFLDQDPRGGLAYQQYLSRMATFDSTGEAGQWASVVLDSVTFLEIAARKHAQYVLNPYTKEPRQWYATSTEACEEQLMLRFGSLRCNVGIACHIDDSKSDMHGNTIRVPNAPGRLRKHLASAYTEFYRLFIQQEEDGGATRWLQTQPDDEWAAGSMIEGIDRFVEPHYKALRKAMENEP